MELLKKIFLDIKKQGGRAFIVGGYVRDTLLHIKSHDYDCEIHGLKGDQLEDILKNYGTILYVGKSFGVYKLSEYPYYDFALARKETKTGIKHQEFECEFITDFNYYEACKRRDLTINSILYDPLSDEYIDPFNGIKDIQNKTIRACDDIKFKEDVLRLFRVARFLAKFPDFTVTKDTKELCQSMVKDIPTLHQNRIFDEYTRLLMSERPSVGLRFLHDIQALPQCLQILSTIDQRHDFHPEKDVFTHTLLVVDIAALVKEETSNPVAFMFSALFHDIGKAITTTKNGSSANHDLIGEMMIKNFFYDFSNNITISKYVKLMTRLHMVLQGNAKKKDQGLEYLRVLKRINGLFPINDLYLLTCCDKYGRYALLKKDNTVEKVTAYLNKNIEKYGTKLMEPYIKGIDLIQLNIPKGPLYKQILDITYEMQFHGYTKEELIKYILDTFGG